MRKIAIVLLMLMALTMPCALADDQNETDEETQTELETMNTAYGAEVRLLQLEKSVTRNILMGQEVVGVLKAPEKNTSELEAILSEMKLLKDEITAADPKAEDAVQIFVDLKSDARALSKDFREKARTLLTAEDIAKIKAKKAEIEKEKLKDLIDKIKDKIKKQNMEHFRAVFGTLGIQDQELLTKFQNGTITKDGLRDTIKERMKAMNQEERKATFAELKESKVKQRVFGSAIMEKVRLNNVVRKETRLTNRLNELQDSDMKEKLQTQIQTRISNLAERKDRIAEKIENRAQAKGGNAQ